MNLIRVTSNYCIYYIEAHRIHRMELDMGIKPNMDYNTIRNYINSIIHNYVKAIIKVTLDFIKVLNIMA